MNDYGLLRAGAASAVLVCALAAAPMTPTHQPATYSESSSASTGPDSEAAALLSPPAQSHPLRREISSTSTTLKLDRARDYIVTIREGAVLTRGVAIIGGHNVILKPGTLRYVPPPGAKPTWLVRGLYLKGQTGTAYVSDLQIRGPLNEGINLDQRERGVVVALRNITVDLVRGSARGHHADLLQTWAGPAKLVVDGFTGSSNYQGFFLKPNQKFRGPKPTFFWMNDVRLDMRLGAYALWADGHRAFPLYVKNTQIVLNPSRTGRDAWLWPKPSTGDTTWMGVVAD
jgi:hypothetical protein